MRWKSSSIAILFCIYSVVKYINGQKLVLKNHFWELLTNKVRKLFVFIMWAKNAKTMQDLALILLLLMQNLFGKMADILEKFKK